MDPIVTGSLIAGGSQVANGLIEQIFAEHNRKRNFYWNEKAADAADQRQREQYMDLYSPQAQLEQYQAAGLSPSMMMSGGQSATGSSSAQGNMSAGLQGPYPSGIQIDPISAAQIANINADTKVKEQQAINIGADTDFTMANILKAAEETENYKQRNMLLILEREKTQLDIDLQKETNPETIKQCLEKTEQMYLQSEKLKNENKSIDLENQLDEATLQTRIKQLSQEYETQIAETALKWANVQLSKQQVQSLIDNVAINNYNATTNRLNTENDRRQINEQIAQWAKQNGFTEQQLKQENTKNWLTFATNVFGSICHLAGSLGSAALKAK